MKDNHFIDETNDPTRDPYSQNDHHDFDSHESGDHSSTKGMDLGTYRSSFSWRRNDLEI